MRERIMKFLPRDALFVWIGCLAVTCSFSGLNEKSRVENRKPIPEFSIPERVPGRNYVYFIAIGDQGEGGSSQKHVARLMNEKAPGKEGGYHETHNSHRCIAANHDGCDASAHKKLFSGDF